MDLLAQLRDYFYYSENFQKINTKLDGLQPFVLRDYQRRFINFLNDIEGPKRAIVLKPRQAGFSTLVGSYFTHRMSTEENFKCIALADKAGRTLEIANMYKTFIEELPEGLRPMIALKNTEQIVLDNPSEKHRQELRGLRSSVRFETGQDPNAGRSGTRRGAHISEVAFIRYMKEIDDGCQNSIPLDPDTAIIKESTANGRAGIGKAFYDLWQASKRGESIYKPFFVAWYEIEDYQIKPETGFKPTAFERDILKRFPTVTEANLMWRRLKLSEYLNDDENLLATPEERFCQDFPLDDEEAFLSTGAPVFDPHVIKELCAKLNNNKVNDIKDRLQIDDYLIKKHWDGLRIYTPPREHVQYFIGADIAEGLAVGDASSLCVIDQHGKQVARWHGKIDPDIFGHLLMALGYLYNEALLIPERNNMGISTVLTIRNEGYPRLYKEVYEDKVTKSKATRYGWNTNKVSKMTMLNNLVKMVRDKDAVILDIRLAEEMGLVSREENGTVNLNGKDRVVGACLAYMGMKQTPIFVKSPKERQNKELYDTRIGEALKPKKEKGDIFG